MAATLNILIGASLATAQVSAGNPSRGLVGGGGTTQAISGPYADQTWTRREFLKDVNLQPVFGDGEMVDIVRWRGPGMDPEDPLDDVWFIYVTGYMTTENGATVFATHKYEAKLTSQGQTQWLASAYYPPVPSQAVGTNRAVAMAVDANGDIYVTGESFDAANGNGQDYVTIRYDSDLVADPLWSPESRLDGAGNDDVPADIFVMGETLLVTGRSVRSTTGNDIMTVLLNKLDGTLSTRWPALGADPVGVRTYDGSASGDDTAVGVTGVEIVVQDDIDALAWVGGTSLRDRVGAPDDNDIVALAYSAGASFRVEQLFDRNIPGGGSEDVATDMAGEPIVEGNFFNALVSRLVICGYTSSDLPGAHPNDTDYVVLNYWQLDPINNIFLFPAWDNNGARYFNGLAASEFSDDRAWSIDTSEWVPGTREKTKAWVTGRVREANGTNYDITTIMYDVLDFYEAALGSARWETTGQPDADDVGMAVEAYEDEAFVTGYDIRGNTLDYVTHKFSVATPNWPVWSIAFDAQSLPDFGFAIVAYQNLDNEFPVFVTGGSTVPATSRDPFTIRYDQK